MAALISGLPGCGIINDTQANAVTKGLTDKYHKDFVVTAIGNRYNYETTTAYAYAADDPTTQFVVRLNSNNEIEFDNYAHRNVCSKMRKLVCDTFSEYGIDSICVAETSHCKFDVSLDISISEYINVTGSDTMKAAILAKLDDNVNAQNLEKIYEKIGSQFPQITVGFNLYTVSNEDYEKIYGKIEARSEYFDLSDLTPHEVKPENIMYVEFKDGQLSVNTAEIEELLRR